MIQNSGFIFDLSIVFVSTTRFFVSFIDSSNPPCERRIEEFGSIWEVLCNPHTSLQNLVKYA